MYRIFRERTSLVVLSRLSNDLSERVFYWLIPPAFLHGKHGFQAKVLCVFSLVVSALGLVVLAGLIVSEGQLPARRLGTLVLACMYFLVP